MRERAVEHRRALAYTGFQIMKKNHCDGDIFEHSFRLRSLKPCTKLYLCHSDFSALFRTLKAENNIRIQTLHYRLLYPQLIRNVFYPNRINQMKLINRIHMEITFKDLRKHLLVMIVEIIVFFVIRTHKKKKLIINT